MNIIIEILVIFNFVMCIIDTIQEDYSKATLHAVFGFGLTGLS